MANDNNNKKKKKQKPRRGSAGPSQFAQMVQPPPLLKPGGTSTPPPGQPGTTQAGPPAPVPGAVPFGSYDPNAPTDLSGAGVGVAGRPGAQEIGVPRKGTHYPGLDVQLTGGPSTQEVGNLPWSYGRTAPERSQGRVWPGMDERGLPGSNTGAWLGLDNRPLDLIGEPEFGVDKHGQRVRTNQVSSKIPGQPFHGYAEANRYPYTGGGIPPIIPGLTPTQTWSGQPIAIGRTTTQVPDRGGKQEFGWPAAVGGRAQQVYDAATGLWRWVTGAAEDVEAATRAVVTPDRFRTREQKIAMGALPDIVKTASGMGQVSSAQAGGGRGRPITTPDTERAAVTAGRGVGRLETEFNEMREARESAEAPPAEAPPAEAPPAEARPRKGDKKPAVAEEDTGKPQSWWIKRGLQAADAAAAAAAAEAPPAEAPPAEAPPAEAPTDDRPVISALTGQPISRGGLNVRDTGAEYRGFLDRIGSTPEQHRRDRVNAVRRRRGMVSIEEMQDQNQQRRDENEAGARARQKADREGRYTTTGKPSTSIKRVYQDEAPEQYRQAVADKRAKAAGMTPGQLEQQEAATDLTRAQADTLRRGTDTARFIAEQEARGKISEQQMNERLANAGMVHEGSIAAMNVGSAEAMQLARLAATENISARDFKLATAQFKSNSNLSRAALALKSRESSDASKMNAVNTIMRLSMSTPSERLAAAATMAQGGLIGEEIFQVIFAADMSDPNAMQQIKQEIFRILGVKINLTQPATGEEADAIDAALNAP